ncbi:flagellar filament capping protein FliD [Pantoea ananatis]|uniref:flagellar filament capping protein FliD n=1 Tax=Pantoea ananas TaxID=553 RepID=UPI000DA6B055|nr:flagellar filament capping protein FliD [Pantoea ananatis]PZD57820.1 flagellar filament capping protein FliD [Pantoea ananatis]PZD60642.1 flagellar filament capping protein FliD [Pantoea ananatis]
MASISSLGAGTNLDLNTLYNSLETAEQTKLTPITKQQSSYNAQLTAWGVVKTGLSKFQTAAAALQNASTIAATKVTSTNTAFTATLASKASAGNYSVEVSQLASAQSLLSKAATSKDTDLGDQSLASRTITISQSGQKSPLTVTLTKDQTSLADIRDAINKQQGSVNASIIKADDNTYYLSLTARDSGTANAMTVSSNDGSLSQYINYSQGGSSNAMTEQVAAKDAQLKINGVSITRSSNTITDAPEGVTLNLTKTTAANTPETLTVATDNQPMTAAIQAYVDAYNSLQTTIGNQTKYTAVKAGESQSTGNGDLLGDNTLRNIQTSLRSQLSSPQSGGNLTTLSQLGITQDVNGKLTVDSTKLNNALTNQPTDVLNFLTGDGKTTGFATQTNNKLTQILASGGQVQNATNGINTSLKKLSDQYDNVNSQIAATMARYKTQFTSLSTLVSSMTQTGNYLTQQFAKL